MRRSIRPRMVGSFMMRLDARFYRAVDAGCVISQLSQLQAIPSRPDVIPMERQRLKDLRERKSLLLPARSFAALRMTLLRLLFRMIDPALAGDDEAFDTGLEVFPFFADLVGLVGDD